MCSVPQRRGQAWDSGWTWETTSGLGSAHPPLHPSWLWGPWGVRVTVTGTLLVLLCARYGAKYLPSVLTFSRVAPAAAGAVGPGKEEMEA